MLSVNRLQQSRICLPFCFVVWSSIFLGLSHWVAESMPGLSFSLCEMPVPDSWKSKLFLSTRFCIPVSVTCGNPLSGSWLLVRVLQWRSNGWNWRNITRKDLYWIGFYKMSLIMYEFGIFAVWITFQEKSSEVVNQFISFV